MTGQGIRCGGGEAVAFCFSEAESGDRKGSCSGEGRLEPSITGDDDHEVEKVENSDSHGGLRRSHRSDGRDQDVEA